MTVASIAQKEGYFTKYFGDVARVVYNRLAAGMHLDMTSTVLYALGQDGGPVTPADQSYVTPYNTYLNPGLTPTPICIVTEAALAAAVSPPPGAWLYFDVVTTQKGTMVFSDTYAGQLAAEAQAAASAGRRARRRTRARDDLADLHHRVSGAGGGPGRPLLVPGPAQHRVPRPRGRRRVGRLPGTRSVRGGCRRGHPGTRTAGVAVTMPHKAAFAALVDRCTPVAARLGAVNTVLRTGDRLEGDNTDGEGFIASLRRGAGLDPAGKRCAVLGAGGAARAVVLALADRGRWPRSSW